MALARNLDLIISITIIKSYFLYTNQSLKIVFILIKSKTNMVKLKKRLNINLNL